MGKAWADGTVYLSPDVAFLHDHDVLKNLPYALVDSFRQLQ
jgi:hypothetical protein